MIKFLIKAIKQSVIALCMCPKVTARELCKIIENTFLYCPSLCYGQEDEEMLKDEQTVRIQMGYEDPYPGVGSNRYYRKWVSRCCVVCDEMIYYLGLPRHFNKEHHTCSCSHNSPRPNPPIVHQPVSIRDF